MKNEILFGEDAIARLTDGADILANAVKVTLGAKGRNVVIKQTGVPAIITKDGVTVANHTTDEDPVRQTGIDIVREAASNTVQQTGDGTTTSIILARAMIKRGLDFIKEGHNIVEIRNGMDKAVRGVVSRLESLSYKVDDFETLKRIATISANGDTLMGEMVASLVYETGPNGVFQIVDSDTRQTTVSLVDGCQIDAGYYDNRFINNHERKRVELENPYVLIASEEVDTYNRIAPILAKCIQEDRPLFIMAKIYGGEAFNILLRNSKSCSPDARINIGAIKAPDYGDYTHFIMHDICTLTGARMWSRREGNEKLIPELLGECSRIEITETETIITGGKGDKVVIDNRIKQITTQIDAVTSPFEKETLRTRAARLGGSVGLIKVGAASGLELREKKYRIDDAIGATKSALQEGVIAGGGVALVDCIENARFETPSTNAEKAGVDIVIGSLILPYQTILENAGTESRGYHGGYPHGIDVMNGRTVNMIEAGIIDPKKVARVCVENAASVAAMFLTTQCAIVEKAE